MKIEKDASLQKTRVCLGGDLTLLDQTLRSSSTGMLQAMIAEHTSSDAWVSQCRASTQIVQVAQKVLDERQG